MTWTHAMRGHWTSAVGYVFYEQRTTKSSRGKGWHAHRFAPRGIVEYHGCYTTRLEAQAAVEGRE
jgi:hypothetical protein